jgi:hypothetical protein
VDPATITIFLGWVDAITRGGPLLVALVIIYTGARGIWIWRSQHEAIIKLHEQRHLDLIERINDITSERDGWQSIAERGANVLEHSTEQLASARRVSRTPRSAT